MSVGGNDGAVWTVGAVAVEKRARLSTVAGLGLGATSITILVTERLWMTSISAQIAAGAASATLMSLGGLFVVLGVRRDGITRWRIGPWYLLWSCLAFGFASFTWLGPQQDLAAQIAPEYVVAALHIYTAATLVWTVGYLAPLPPSIVRGTARSQRLLLRGSSTLLRGASAPWILYGAGSLARLTATALTGRLGYVGDATGLVQSARPYTMALECVATLAVFAIAAAALRAFTVSTPWAYATLWLLVATESVVGALAGGKQSFVVALLAVVIPYGAVRGRLAMRVIVPGAVVFILIVAPFNVAYRQVVRHGSEAATLSPSVAIPQAPDVLSRVADPESLPGQVSDSFQALLSRVRLIDSLAIVTQRTPSMIPYRDPLEFVTAPIAGSIPRVIWPDKPVLSTGYQFSRDYYGLPPTVLTSSAITPVGDLYRHGGWSIVVVGMFLLGLACRGFDAAFRPERDLRAVCFILVFLPIIVKSELDVYTMLMNVPVGLLTAAMGAQLMFRRQSAVVRRSLADVGVEQEAVVVPSRHQGSTSAMVPSS